MNQQDMFEDIRDKSEEQDGVANHFPCFSYLSLISHTDEFYNFTVKGLGFVNYLAINENPLTGEPAGFL